MIKLITGGRNSGKTTKLKEIYNKNKGFGFYSEKVFIKDQLIGYDLVSLDFQYRFKFIRLHDFDFTKNDCFYNKRFKFDLTVIEDIEKLILKSKEHTIYLDEIGKLELKFKKGFYALINRLKEKDINLYVTVNSENIDDLKLLINRTCKVINQVSIGAVIMASGDSKRFGSENKLLHVEKNKTIFEHVLENIINANVFSQIIVVTKYNEIKRISNKYHQIETVENKHAQLGISESIKLGTNNFKSYIDGYMYIPADQLYLSIDTLNRLTKAFRDNTEKIIIPVFNHLLGSPKIFPASLKKELLDIYGDIGGRQVVNKNKNKILRINFEENIDNFDINKLEDLRRDGNET